VGPRHGIRPAAAAAAEAATNSEADPLVGSGPESEESPRVRRGADPRRGTGDSGLPPVEGTAHATQPAAANRSPLARKVADTNSAQTVADNGSARGMPEPVQAGTAPQRADGTQFVDARRADGHVAVESPEPVSVVDIARATLPAFEVDGVR